jgi:hypothetical protein
MLVLALTTLPLVATAQLASSDKLVAQVPFEFVLGNKVVPGREWILRPATMDGMILQIRTKDSEVNMLSPVILVDSKKASQSLHAALPQIWGTVLFVGGEDRWHLGRL